MFYMKITSDTLIKELEYLDNNKYKDILIFDRDNGLIKKITNIELNKDCIYIECSRFD